MEVLLNISIAMLVLVVTLLLNRYGKGMISSASIFNWNDGRVYRLYSTWNG